MTCKFSCKDQFGIVNYINDHGRPQDDDDSRDPAAPPAHRRRLTKPQTSLGCSKCRYAANGCTECRLRFNLWQQRRGWHWVVRLKHVNFDCLGSWVTDSTGQNQCFQWNKQHFFHNLTVMKQLHHPPSFCSSFETFGIDGKSLFKINSGPNSFIMVSAWQNRVGTICGSLRWHGISDTDHPLAVKNGLNNSKGFRIFQCNYSSLAINFVQWLDKWASKKLAFTANRLNQTETFGSIITSANYSQSESFWPGV